MIQKNIYLLTTVVILITITFMRSPVFSVSVSITPSLSPSPTPTKEQTPIDSTIKSLKEKIENKVEEINKRTKKMIKGRVVSTKGNAVQITSPEGKKYTVTIDDTITTFYKVSVTGLDNAEQSDAEEGAYVLVQGPEIEDQVTANSLYIQPQYLVLSGQITTTDKDTFTISLVTQSRDTYTFDIEKGTKQLIMNSKDLSLSKSGFSKFRIGDRVHFVAEKSTDESSKNYSAIRTVIIPQEYFSEELSPTKSE